MNSPNAGKLANNRLAWIAGRGRNSAEVSPSSNGHQPGLTQAPPGVSSDCNMADRTAINPIIKYLLFLTNFAFSLVGLALVVAGSYILYMKDKVVASAIEFFFDPVCLIVLVGSIVLAVSFLGLLGSLREYVCCLKSYYYILNILFLFEILIIIFIFVFYFVDSVKDFIYPDEFFRTAITRYRDDTDMQNFIDDMQRQLSCCGTSNTDTGYLDWNLNEYFNCSDGRKSSEACGVPFSCCIINQGDAENLLCGVDVLKESQLQAATRIHTRGCIKAVGDYIQENALMVGGVCIGVLIPQIMFACLARRLLDQISIQKSKWHRHSRE